MDALHSDTIVAPITGTAKAAVALIRLSGPNSFEIAAKVFSPWPEPLVPRLAVLGHYDFSDTGLMIPFLEGASFTGEESVEFSVHGGTASKSALLDACLKAGARMAVPGEFSLRAFLNGKLDLSQAEAISEIVEAQSSRQLQLASRNLNGNLRRSIEELIEEIASELARLEASVDFSEEIGEYDFEAGASSIKKAQDQLISLIERGRIAHRARQGVRVAIVGRPNSGKSSLFNSILNMDRSIVSNVAGTTRDTIEESLEWEGVPLVLIDTAGVREVDEQIEQLGIERTYRSVETSDLILYLYDASEGWQGEDEAILGRLPTDSIVVANKIDLGSPEKGIGISAKNGEGVPGLLSEISQRIAFEGESSPVNDRQSLHMQSAAESLSHALAALDSFQPPDLISVLLNEALDSLGKVSGSTASPDMLTEIFSRFCLGK